MIGPWCFLDRFGPLTFSQGKPMDVAPHPHIGLQTVTWLLDGEVVHDDSLGYESVLRPNGVNVMTSGAGIAHAEQTPRDNSGRLNGVQLWVALLDAQRHIPPGFMQVKEIPLLESPDALIRVFAGTLQGTTSPAPHYSDLLGADVDLRSRRTCALPLNPAYEHAVLVLSGDCTLEDQRLEERSLALPWNEPVRGELRQPRRRPHTAHWWPAFSGVDPDVVELRGADRRRDRTSARRLGETTTIWGGYSLPGTAPVGA